MIKEELGKVEKFKPVKISSDLGKITCNTQDEYEKAKLKLNKEKMYRWSSSDWGDYVHETWVNGYEMKKLTNQPI